MVAGFADELTKTAGLRSMVEAIKENPEMRKALARAAGVGALATGAQTALTQGTKHIGKHMLGGAAAGAVTGLAFPSWYSKHIPGPL